MTTRSEGNQRLRELKTNLMTRLARRVMTTRTTGLDGLAKRLLGRPAQSAPPPDPDLEHPIEWDRPLD